MLMHLCSDGHAEICYAGTDCPACDLKNQIQQADEETSAALAKVDELRGTIDSIRSQVEGV